jgi:hypothetical protein
MANVVAGSISTVDKTIRDKVVNEDAQKQTWLDTTLKWAPFALLIHTMPAGAGVRIY